MTCSSPADAGPDDGPTLEEIQAEAVAFRQPAPPPIPVRERFYITECEHCGWVGSSEQCGSGSSYGDDADIVCPVCCDSMAGDSPSEADQAKHGEAVFQRIVALEAALATERRARAEAERKLEEARAALDRIIEGAPTEEPEPHSDSLGYVSQDPDDNYEAGKLAQHWDLAEIARAARAGASGPSLTDRPTAAASEG